MDDHRFDVLTKAFGSSGSRRRLLKGLLGVGGAAAIGTAIVPSESEAARRPTPTPKPVTCPGQQTWDVSQCTCPDGLSKCGPACCNPNGTGADHSECCDNACCQGTCYGEELCCPYPRAYCPTTGECCPEGAHCCDEFGCLSIDLCCSDADCTAFPNSSCDPGTHTCVCVPATCASLGTCGQVSDGCGNTLDCGCCTDADCQGSGFPNGWCDPNTHTCACTQSSCPSSGCGTFSDGCGSNIECGCGLGYVCSGGTCVDDLSICVEGEEYCTGTNGASCGGGDCFCTQGVDGTTYCVGSLYLGFDACGNCTSNADCRAKIADPTAVCVNRNHECRICNGNGACAPICGSPT